MGLYLKAKKLDRESMIPNGITLNAVDAQTLGVNEGDIINFSSGNVSIYVSADITDTDLNEGYVGMNEEIWTKYKIPNDTIVELSMMDRPKSIEHIKKKLLGERLNEEELADITRDISERKIHEVEIAYFMSTFFNPGFNDDEVLYTIKGMANAGDILDFKNIRNNGDMVVDKHSIGGVAAKGITPILVPIIASHGLVIPNTSTRAITTPAGTTDILEVVMPVALENDELLDVVRKTGGCMVWGGALKLSPADDVLITVERGLHIQSFQKLLVSIIAKKVSMGISHMVIDIPYGPGTKVPNPDDVELLKDGFITLFAKVGIKCEVYTRMVSGPDGYGVGPNLEVRDILRIFERHERRPKILEETALGMCAVLLEMTGTVPEGEGLKSARAKLESGEALEKFWEIGEAQGAKERVTSEDIQKKMGEYSESYKATTTGKIQVIDNKEIVKIARALGNPFTKEAGIDFHYTVGEKVRAGEDLVTIYAASMDRLNSGKNALDMDKLLTIKPV